MNDVKMKISFFIGSMSKGGAEKVISILANEFCRQGHDIEIVLLLKNEIDYKLYNFDHRISFVDLSPKKPGYLKNVVYWIRKTRKYLKTSKPNKVISFIGRINCVVLSAAIGLKIPVYVSERNDPRHDGRGKFILWYCNKIYKRAYKIIFQTKYEMSCFSKKLYKKSVVLPNPVDVSFSWKPESDGFFKIVNTARLNQQKNHFMLLKAVKKLYSDGYKVRCTIYGEGEMRHALETFIEKEKLSDVIFLPGNISNVCSLVSRCDVFVQTSYYEGLSNSLLEAMCIGMPCICTNYPGVDELIQDGNNGFLIPINDCESLYQQIKQLINNTNISTSVGERAFHFSKAFSLQSVIEKWNKEIF